MIRNWVCDVLCGGGMCVRVRNFSVCSNVFLILEKPTKNKLTFRILGFLYF